MNICVFSGKIAGSYGTLKLDPATFMMKRGEKKLLQGIEREKKKEKTKKSTYIKREIEPKIKTSSFCIIRGMSPQNDGMGKQSGPG